MLGNATKAFIAIAVAAGIAAATTNIVVMRAEAAALVGETRTVEIAKQPAATIDKLRADYRRPNFIPFPKDDPYTAEKASLGKKLYFDSRLSEPRLLACASCHSPAYAWGDGQPKGIGHLMKQLGRRSPTIINAAWGQIFMWDGRMATLEQQALGPITGDVEMALTLPELVKRLQGIPEYKPLFEAAFPGQSITAENAAKAIATYERTVVSGRAPFDAWAEGDNKAISESAKRGFALFNGKANCAACHSSWRFTDDSFHDIGLKSDDIGRGQFLKDVPKAEHAFKTPGLREITRRAPYMHDGSLATLAAVVDHYNTGGIDRPSRSDIIKPLGLTAQEEGDLVAFMQTLTSDVDPTTVPVLPR
jgi:cytochrome c peroxidase